MADDGPQNAEFIGRVVSDAKNPPDARLLTGWFGDAGEEGKRRLYTSADLSAYVDLPSDAILHSEPVRDSQPPGAFFVWVRRDAVPEAGGSAASRAARFLQGQVTQDFGGGGGGGCVDLSSPEKAGYRCITQVPCGEPTGFTGRCTKQPEVGGAWPCITAAPLCVEVTGFTGKCTPLPWPHPTKYVGCTILHCPTHDLTHIQQICNIVATGMPGCGEIDPGIGGGPVEKQAVEGTEGSGGAAAAVAPTSLLGCGYTQTWGLCETKLLGCGTTQIPKCQVSVQIPCITRTEMPQQCPNLGGNLNFAAAAQAGPAQSTQILQCNPSAVDACPTRINCETQPPTSFCTQPPDCRTCWPDCQTNQPNCTQFNCVTFPNGDCTFFGGCIQPTPPEQAGAQAFAGAARLGVAGGGGAQFVPRTSPILCWQPTPATHCFICPLPQITQSFLCGGGGGNPSAFDACPTGFCPVGAQPVQAQAQAAGPGLGTQILQCNPSAVDACPTRINCETLAPGCRTCGPDCQTRQPGCTQVRCLTFPNGDCTFFNCPTMLCPEAQPQAGAQAFAGAAPGAAQPGLAGGGAQITLLTIPVWQCKTLPTPATHCFICPQPSPLPWHCQPSPFPWLCPPPSPWCPPITQTWICGGGGPSAVDACPTRICGGGGGLGGDPAAGRFAQPAQAQAVGNLGNFGGNFGRTDAAFGGGCPPFFTQFANQCVLQPITFELECPTALCPPTSPPQCPHTVQGCPTSFPNCHTLVACTVAGPRCPITVIGTVFGPQCNVQPQGTGVFCSQVICPLPTRTPGCVWNMG